MQTKTKNIMQIKLVSLAILLMFGFILSISAQVEIIELRKGVTAQLLELNANAPKGTTAVRFYIDDVRVSELTNLYALQTGTKAVWNTLIDPQWFEPGEHYLRVEADTYSGGVILESKKITIIPKEIDENKTYLTGSWEFAEMGSIIGNPAEGTNPVAVQSGFSEGDWYKVMVPNSLGYINSEWNNNKGLIGMYRRTINLDEVNKGEQYDIILESIYWSARVFINGKEVGNTTGGYLQSRFDITDALVRGKNSIAIITDNRLSKMGVFKRLNEFYWNWGGILQEVYIEHNPNVSIYSMRAEGAQTGKLKLYLSGKNTTSSTQIKKVKINVYDPSNKKVVSETIKIEIPVSGGKLKPIEVNVKNPALWNLETPNMYTVKLTGEWGILEERTGFRDVVVSGSNILVNGKVMENLQGFNRHADYPGLGRTQPDGLAYKELKELYNKGFRLFRPGHYPTTPALLDAADELGMLVIEEINVTGLNGDQLSSPEVIEFGAQQLTKMIDRDRSHPSIIAWSVGNENLTEDPKTKKYIRETIGLGRSLDPSRLYTHVTMRHTRDKTFEFQDFVAQNYYAGWYSKDFDNLANFFDGIQEYSGNKPVMLSEYGAEAVIGRPGVGKGTEFYQSYIVDAHNQTLDNKKNFFGKMYWTSSEFWCRPNWTGGNPAPIPPFHVKAISGYYRNYNKLGWRVMFSPIRLSFDDSAIEKSLLGGVIRVDKNTSKIQQSITVNDIRGKATEGTLIIEAPKGFTADKTKIHFRVEPNQSVTLKFVLEGKMPSSSSSSKGYIKAIIDKDTEAQPLELVIESNN